MADLTLPLIGLTTLAGYFFSRDGRNPRAERTVRQNIESFDKPNGKNIYTSNVVNEANEEILQRSLENYKLAENPSETGFIPPLFNTYSIVGNDSMLSPVLVSDSVGLSSEQLGKLNDLNRLQNVVQTNTSDKKDQDKKEQSNVDNRPMFRSFDKYIGQETNPTTFTESDFSLPYKQTEINLLTGKPFEKTHANMVPFFGSNIKQNIETFSNEALLDSRAGNTSTYKHKKETASMYDTKPENIYGNPVFATQVDTDRYIPSLYRQNEKPVEPERIAAPISGTFDNNIRPVFKDVNDLRPGNRPKETYEGRTLSGKMGENRGIQGKVEKHRPDTFFENNHRFAGPGEYVGPKSREDYALNMKSSSRQSYNIEYYGANYNQASHASKQRLSTVDNSDELSAYFQNPKRHNFENDYLRNVDGTILQNQSSHDYGRSALTVPESERATTGLESYLLNANLEGQGIRLKLQDEMKMTLKQTTMKTDNTGNVNSAFNSSGNDPYHSGMSNVVAKQTHKQTMVDNKYKGQVHKDDGMGYLVNKHEAKTTGKEIVTERSEGYVTNAGKIIKNPTVQSTYANPEKVRNAIHPEYKGNVKYSTESESRTRFDNAVIRDEKQQVIMGQRPSGPQNFQISSGKGVYGDIKSSENMLLKELEDTRDKIINDYKHTPTKDQLGIPIRTRQDDEAIDTVTNDRLQPELAQFQLANNPFFIDTSKKI
jgi:hypothetical protein